jgi:predicted homoserine dehydrogenase-like protein
MGLSGGCRVKKDVAKGQALTVEDVEMPEDRMCDALWKKQNETFFP